MSLILISLSVMVVISFISIVSGNNFAGAISEIDGAFTQALNGTESDLGLAGSEMFMVDPVLGAIYMFVAIAGIAGVVGITVLGTGVDSEGVKTIIWVTTYGALWSIMSLLSYPLLLSIEIFGGTLYLLLTFLYVIGVVKQLSGG